MVRELDERLGFGELIESNLAGPRRGKNRQFALAGLFCQSVYSRLAGSEKIWDRGAALASRLQSSETEMPAEPECNFATDSRGRV